MSYNDIDVLAQIRFGYSRTYWKSNSYKPLLFHMLNVQVIREEAGSDEIDIQKMGKKEYISINGKIYKNAVFFTGSNDEIIIASLSDEDAINALVSETFADVGKYIYMFNCYEDTPSFENGVTLRIYCRSFDEYICPSIEITPIINKDEWKKPFSISEFSKALKFSVEDELYSVFTFKESNDIHEEPGFSMLFRPHSKNAIIREEIGKAISIANQKIKKAMAILAYSLDKEALITFFDFPDEIKIACQQYLVYFIQFLSDLGIEATSDIKEELGHTLFKVIPKNKYEALGTIKEALQIYLNAPGTIIFESNTQHPPIDVAVQHWQANILQLRSQLMLAQSTIQMKEATIEMLQISNYQYKQILIDSKKNDEPEEDLIEGIVAIKKYDGKGFTINMPEILRRLKRRFHRT